MDTSRPSMLINDDLRVNMGIKWLRGASSLPFMLSGIPDCSFSISQHPNQNQSESLTNPNVSGTQQRHNDQPRIHRCNHVFSLVLRHRHVCRLLLLSMYYPKPPGRCGDFLRCSFSAVRPMECNYTSSLFSL